MNSVESKRTKEEERFTRNLFVAFASIRKTLLVRMNDADRSTTAVLKMVDDIIRCGSPQIGQTTDNQLYQQLLAENQHYSAERLEQLMVNSTAALLKQAVENAHRLKELFRTLPKQAYETTVETSKKSKRQKRREKKILNEKDAGSWMEYFEAVNTQSYILACVDKKLDEGAGLGKRERPLVGKFVRKMRKLVRLYINSGDISAAEDSDENQKAAVDETSKSKKNKNKAAGKASFRRRLTKAGIQVAPWPVHGEDDAGITPQKPVDYDMFLASSFRRDRVSSNTKTAWEAEPLEDAALLPVSRSPPTDAKVNVNPTSPSITPDLPSPHSNRARIIRVKPVPRTSSSASDNGPDNGLDDVTPASSVEELIRPSSSTDDHRPAPLDNETLHTPLKASGKASNNKAAEDGEKTWAWSGSAPVSPAVDSLPLASLKNVYLRVVRQYKASNKKELSLKVGEIVKQKQEANEDGMAYGWKKTGRLGLKKRGFYPISCVQLREGP